jgi:hypothetical protein
MREALENIIEGQMLFDLVSEDTVTYDFTFIIKETMDFINKYPHNPKIELRTGLLKIDNIQIVPMMILVNQDYDMMYECTLNIFNPVNESMCLLKQLGKQDFIPIIFFNPANNPVRKLMIKNNIQEFFEEVIMRMSSFPAWEMDEFDKAKQVMYKNFSTPKLLWNALEG